MDNLNVLVMEEAKEKVVAELSELPGRIGNTPWFSCARHAHERLIVCIKHIIMHMRESG
jgi:hypothetical protein